MGSGTVEPLESGVTYEVIHLTASIVKNPSLMLSGVTFYGYMDIMARAASFGNAFTAYVTSDKSTYTKLLPLAPPELLGFVASNSASAYFIAFNLISLRNATSRSSSGK